MPSTPPATSAICSWMYVDLDVVDEPEVDDAHAQLGVLDRVQDVAKLLDRSHGGILDHGRTARPGRQTRISGGRSLVKVCVVSMKRTRLQREHMTIECVRAPSAW
jgi:hypothetical protein